VTKAIELCEAAGKAEDAGFAYNLLEWIHLWKGNYHQVLALKEEALRMIEQQFNLRWHVWALSAATWAYAELGRWDDAVSEGEKALSVAEEYSNDLLIGFADLIIAIAYTLKGDLVRAVEYAELAVQKAPTPADSAWAQQVLASAWCSGADPGRGVELLARIIPMYRAAGYYPGEVNATVILGEGYWQAGEYEKARETLERGLELAEQYGMKYNIGYAHRLLGEIALKRQPSLATLHFEKSVAILQHIKAENELALAHSGYGRFHKQQGNIEQAREYLTNALEIFERLGTLIEPDKVRKELGELPKE
jgi:tetratricopeptide (TPR) repeat protein